jgi:hypothetical protein
MIHTSNNTLFYYFKRLAAVFTVGVSLASCADKDIFTQLDSAGYIPNQKEFRPAIVHLVQGEPYIMLVENRDDVAHFLAAKGFFKTVAIRKILTQTEEISGVNLIGLYLDPGEVKEVHFIPFRDGWYDFEGGHSFVKFKTDLLSWPFSRGTLLGMVGSFVVEE